MKKIILLSLSAIALAGCGNNTEETSTITESEVTTETVENEPTQEELNAKIKEVAAQAEFVKANAGEYRAEDKLFATGEVSVASDPEDIMQEFILTTEENGGYGMYEVSSLDQKTKVEDGDQVTIYGTIRGEGKNTTIPAFSTSYIEK